MARKKEPGTSVISVDDLERALAPLARESATALAKAEPVYNSTNIIRTKNKVFKLGETKLDAPLRVIILAQSACQFYYEDEYDPDSPSSPICYALAGDNPFAPDGVTLESRLAPPDDAPKKQSEVCATCPKNKPGSYEGSGTGSKWRRACQGRRRLAFLFADDKSDNPEIGSIEISPGGLRPWTNYIKSLVGINGLPFYMVVTELHFVDTKEDNWYVGGVYGGPLTRSRPDWLMPKGVKVGSDGWLDTTMIGRKVHEVVDSKMLLAPPQQLSEEPRSKKKARPVTGAERVSVRDAKAKRAAKKKRA